MTQIDWIVSNILLVNSSAGCSCTVLFCLYNHNPRLQSHFTPACPDGKYRPLYGSPSTRGPQGRQVRHQGATKTVCAGQRGRGQACFVHICTIQQVALPQENFLTDKTIRAYLSSNINPGGETHSGVTTILFWPSRTRRMTPVGRGCR